MTKKQIDDIIKSKLQEMIDESTSVSQDFEKSFTEWFQGHVQQAILAKSQSQQPATGGEAPPPAGEEGAEASAA